MCAFSNKDITPWLRETMYFNVTKSRWPEYQQQRAILRFSIVFILCWHNCAFETNLTVKYESFSKYILYIGREIVAGNTGIPTGCLNLIHSSNRNYTQQNIIECVSSEKSVRYPVKSLAYKWSLYIPKVQYHDIQFYPNCKTHFVSDNIVLSLFSIRYVFI